MVYLIFQKINAGSLSDLLAIRDGQLFLPLLFYSANTSVTLLIIYLHPDSYLLLLCAL